MSDEIGNLTIKVFRGLAAVIETPDGPLTLHLDHCRARTCTMRIDGPKLNEGVEGTRTLPTGAVLAIRPDVIVKIADTQRGHVRLRIRAPKSYRINRTEPGVLPAPEGNLKLS